MIAIYKPKGRALEYAPLACNLYRGCGHKCTYCYAPQVIRESRESFHNAVVPRKNILASIRKDAARLCFGNIVDPQRVLLSFTSDPYQKENDEHKLTRSAIEILHGYGLSVEILSKGGMRATQDFDLLGDDDRVAATLTSVSDDIAREWEPGAALPKDRMAYLKLAKSRGLVTWASLEPVIDPAESLEIIRQTHTFVDKFKVGTLNHHARSKEIDWRRFGLDAVELLEKLGCDYYIKSDLREAIG